MFISNFLVPPDLSLESEILLKVLFDVGHLDNSSYLLDGNQLLNREHFCEQNFLENTIVTST